MSDIQTLGPLLRRFLCEHIVTERNLTRNTRNSYRDTFVLLLPFLSGKMRKPVDRLTVRDLTSRRLLDFLAHLEDSRGCSVQTRNQRLTAIRAFARFVGSRDPAHVEWCGHIRAIQSKKATPQPIAWLPSRGWRPRRRPRPFGAHSTSIPWATGPTMRASSSCSPRIRTRTIPGGTITPGPFWKRTPRLRDAVVQARAVGAQAPPLPPWLRPLSWDSDSDSFPTSQRRRGEASPSPPNPAAPRTTRRGITPIPSLSSATSCGRWERCTGPTRAPASHRLVRRISNTLSRLARLPQLAAKTRVTR